MSKPFRIYGYDHHHNRDPWYRAPPWAIELRCTLSRMFERLDEDMAQIDDELVELQADVQADTDAENAAIKLIGGIGKMISDAVAAALAAGATPEQLKAISDVDATVKANAANLAAAVAAGTSP